MRIYTRTGDKGQTGLWGGKRVSKSSLRIEAYGTVDELNAFLGFAANYIADQELQRALKRLQNELHVICADLASPDPKSGTPRITADHVKSLEEACDRYDEKLPPLSKFILPGGKPAGAALHVARTVARRAERRVVQLAEQEEINTEIIKYLNRLSDLLFVLARWVNHLEGVPEAHPEY